MKNCDRDAKRRPKNHFSSNTSTYFPKYSKSHLYFLRNGCCWLVLLSHLAACRRCSVCQSKVKGRSGKVIDVGCVNCTAGHGIYGYRWFNFQTHLRVEMIWEIPSADFSTALTTLFFFFFFFFSLLHWRLVGNDTGGLWVLLGLGGETARTNDRISSLAEGSRILQLTIKFTRGHPAH